jgi:hypothetical protein
VTSRVHAGADAAIAIDERETPVAPRARGGARCGTHVAEGPRMFPGMLRRFLSVVLLAAPASGLLACGPSSSSEFNGCGNEATVVVPLATIQALERDAGAGGDAGSDAGEPTDQGLDWKTCAQVCPSTMAFAACTVGSTQGSQATVHCINECPG